MANLNLASKTYINLLKIVSSLLVLTVSMWVALSQPNPIVSGVCGGLCLTSITGLLSSKQILFTTPLLTLATILIYAIVAIPFKGLMTQIVQTFQFLTLIYTIEMGSSTIHINKILQRIKGQTPINAMAKAIKRYMANLTAIITASSAMSALFIFLGNIAQIKLEHISLVAAATAMLIATLAFFASKLRYPSSKTEK